MTKEMDDGMKYGCVVYGFGTLNLLG